MKAPSFFFKTKPIVDAKTKGDRLLAAGWLAEAARLMAAGCVTTGTVTKERGAPEIDAASDVGIPARCKCNLEITCHTVDHTNRCLARYGILGHSSVSGSGILEGAVGTANR